MIEILPSMPNNMVGFKATGEVTQDNFLNIVDPVVRAGITLLPANQLKF
jgi:hypothetical protein